MNLTHEASLGGREERDLVDLREAVGQKLTIEVEGAAAKDVGFDVPAHSLRGFDAARVAHALVALFEELLLDAGHDIDGGVHFLLRHGQSQGDIVRRLSRARMRQVTQFC